MLIVVAIIVTLAITRISVSNNVHTRVLTSCMQYFDKEPYGEVLIKCNQIMGTAK